MLILFLLNWIVGVSFFAEKEKNSDYYRALGEKLYDQEKYEESLSNYRKAFDLVKDHDRIRAANLCNDISSVFYALQKPDSSIRNCYRGLHLLGSVEVGNRPDSLYFKLYSSLGTMYHSLANTDSSAHYFHLSDKLIAKNENLSDQIPEYVLHHYLNQGISLWSKHRYYESISYFERAMELSRRKNMISELSYVYNSLAVVYDLLNQHEKAIEMRKYALSQMPSDRLQGIQAALTGIGRSYRKMNRTDSSLYWYSKSYQTLSRFTTKNLTYHIEHVFLLVELSNLYLQKGEISLARDRVQDALKHYQANKLDNQKLVSNIYLTLGDLEKKQGNLKQAMENYRIAYGYLVNPTDPVQTQFPRHLIRVVLSQIDVYEMLYENSRNLSDLEAALKLYDRIIEIKKHSYKQIIRSDNDRYFYLASNQTIMDRAIRNALDYFENTQTDAALEKLFHRLEDANTTHLMDIIVENIGDQEIDLSVKDIGISRIQSQMDPKTAFITYRLIDNLLVAMVVRKNGVYAHKWVIDTTAFNANLTGLLQEVKQNPGLGVYGASSRAQACYKVLISPLEPWLRGTRRWVVARDWKFSSLPFEVLESRQDHFLADDYSISYTYTASFFWDHPTLLRKRPKTFDAFVYAPFVNHGENSIEGWKSISSMTEVRSMGQDYVYGEEATKQHFLKFAPDHYVLNLATHAFADLKNPVSSYVQFYPGADSKLYLDEIMTMKLPSTRLVMLSSCFGNEGIEYAGEGVISLAYAFARAGCPSLVTTSWEANENTTGYLTRVLSEYLEQGMPIDEALQKARQALRSDRKYFKYNHPYFWANLSLLGNHSPVYERQGFFHLYGVTVLLIILVIGLILIGLRRVNSDG